MYSGLTKVNIAQVCMLKTQATTRRLQEHAYHSLVRHSLSEHSV